jgi:sulfur-oxidizing protein SoxZ
VTGTLATPRIRIPRSARAGEVIEIRTLIEHPMQTGLHQEPGRAAPRDMLTRLLVRLNGETVLAAEFRNGTSANPYHVFFVRMDRTGVFEFTWTDERGRSARAEARVTVG